MSAFVFWINVVAVLAQIAVIGMGLGIWLNYLFIVLCGAFAVYGAIQLRREDSA